MKRVPFTLAVLCCLFSQVFGGWVWVSGSNQTNPAGVYGTKGVGSTANVPPGRTKLASWVIQEELYIFGGSDNQGNAYNDVWKYTPRTYTWTWIAGSDQPGSDGFYGTMGVDNETNAPPARSNPVVWTVSGSAYVFGGKRPIGNGGSNTFNDLWYFNAFTKLWTWVGGPNTTNQPGVYGTIQVADSANIPGARSDSISWATFDGLWLFGGTNSTGDFLNDLWKYSTSSTSWTWIAGAKTGNARGLYGIQGAAPTTTTVPGARMDSIAWTAPGYLYLFGGFGFNSSATAAAGYLNDLWRFDTSSLRWAWISGSAALNDGGVYGTINLPNAQNRPPSRSGSIGWTLSTSNTLYLYGGFSPNPNGYLNDWWSFGTSWAWLGQNKSADVPAIYGTKGISGTFNYPGSRAFGAALPTTDGIFFFGGSAGTSATLNDLWVYVASPLDNGGSCVQNANCKSNICAAGYCCSTVCDPNACSVCNSGTCQLTCDAGTICNSGICQHPNGDMCNVGSDCQSGNCVAGICCDTACVGECYQCSSGTCGYSNNGTSCAPNHDGMCVLGTCQQVNGAFCTAANECQSGFCVEGHCCENACGDDCHTCYTGACNPYANGTSCGTGTGRCLSGACFKNNGQSCASDMECASGACVVGFCCAQKCPNECYQCTAGTTCVPAVATSCMGGIGTCRAGSCLLVNGQNCTEDDSCASGACDVETSICCNVQCDGYCTRCNVNGTCSVSPDETCQTSSTVSSSTTAANISSTMSGSTTGSSPTSPTGSTDTTTVAESGESRVQVGAVALALILMSLRFLL